MASQLRTAWHPLLVTVVRELDPEPFFHVFSELPLTREPIRLDVVVVTAEPGAPEPDLLASLLSSPPAHMLLSYKGASDEPERDDAIQLFAYGLHYMHVTELTDPSLVGLRMLASSITPRFLDQVRALGGVVSRVRAGVWEGTVGPFALRCVAASIVCDQPGEALLYGLSKRMLDAPRRLPPMTDAERLLFTRIAQQVEQLRATGDPMQYIDLDMAAINYEQAMQDLLAQMPPARRLAGLTAEQRLAGLDPEQRLAGLDPEQRLAGLDAAHAVLALPLELLRALSSDYVDTLPDDVKAEILRRLASG